MENKRDKRNYSKLDFGLTSDEVSPQFREVFISSGYRKPYSSAMDCVKSAFQPLNETVNVWTHFVPFLLFLVRFASLIWKYGVFDTYVYPVLSNALGICGFLLMSSGAHLFNSMSPRTRHICFFFDYSAISVYSVGAGQAFYFYGRSPDHDSFFSSSSRFLTVSCLVSFLSTSMCCASRHRWSKMKYVVRTSCFVVAFFCNSAPYTHRLFSEPSHQHISDQELLALSYFKRHCWFYLIAALANTSKMPERLVPGVFDIIGHSHHFLHVFTALGAADQLTAIEIQMESRRSELEKFPIATFGNSLGLMVVICIINCGIVLWFGKLLRSDKEEEQKAV
ncbi:membrane progestin receptor gamma-B-like [Montipora capricornis]|uniref:membrane progestin receptor gamma-B-like n=1 Tax=Montipora capricornis TaxID=246305 RepID=UPI0035F1C064